MKKWITRSLILFGLCVHNYTSFSQKTDTLEYDDWDQEIAIPNLPYRPGIRITRRENNIIISLGDSVLYTNSIDAVTNITGGHLLKRKNKYGVLNSTGQLIVPIQYDTITFGEGTSYIVHNNNKVGSYDLQGGKILSTKYHKVLYSSSKSKISLIETKKGDKKLVFKNNKVYKKAIKDFLFFDSGVIGSHNGQFGCINSSGKIKIPFKYDDLYPQYFHNKDITDSKKLFSQIGKATYLISKQNDKFGIIMPDGKVVFQAKLTKVNYDRRKHIVKVFDGRYWGLFFENTGKKLNPIYQTLFPDGNTYVIVQKDNRKGVVDHNGKIILPFSNYDRISVSGFFGTNKSFKVTRGEKSGWYDTNGNVIVPIEYEQISAFFNPFSRYPKLDDLCKVKWKGKYGVYNHKNKQLIIPCDYDFIFHKKQFIIIKLGEKFGLFNTLGEQIQPLEFDEFRYTLNKTSNTILFMKNGLFGAIDNNGKIVLKAEFEKIDYILNSANLLNSDSNNPKSHLLVSHGNGKKGVLDEQSLNLDLPVEYDEVLQKISSNKRTYFIVQKDGKTGIVNDSNTILVNFDYEELSFSNSTFSDQYPGHDNNFERVYNFTAKKNGKYGIINLKGKVLIPFNFKAIERLHYYYPIYKVKKEKTWAVIRIQKSWNKYINPGPFDEVTIFDNSYAFTFYQGKMEAINKFGEVVYEGGEMNHHVGFKTFQELKLGFIAAMNSPDDSLLLEFTKKIAPSKFILFIAENHAIKPRSKQNLKSFNPALIEQKYFRELRYFKKQHWAKLNLKDLEITDYTLFNKSWKHYANLRPLNRSYGHKFLDALFQNTIRLNGYWISTYFLDIR